MIQNFFLKPELLTMPAIPREAAFTFSVVDDDNDDAEEDDDEEYDVEDEVEKSRCPISHSQRHSTKARQTGQVLLRCNQGWMQA
jgi:hypothetical protein